MRDTLNTHNCKNIMRKHIFTINVPQNFNEIKMDNDIIEDRLVKIYGKLNSIDDIIDLENDEHKYNYINNSKFIKLYNIIPSLKKLKNLTGLKKIKQEIFEHISYFVHNLQTNKELMNIVITGPPGVGKTELGYIIGDIYLELDYLTSNKFIIAKRSDLIGEYLGHTAVKTQKMLDSAMGGVLFIDEIYSLGNSELRDSFSKECIDTINQNLTDNKGKLLCIIAGYKDKIDSCFFAYNEGLKRRFPIMYDIEGYNADELTDIFVNKIRNEGWDICCNIDDIKQFFNENLNKITYYGGDMELLLQKCKFNFSLFLMNSAIDDEIPEKNIPLDIIKKSFYSIIKCREEKDEVPYGIYL